MYKRSKPNLSQAALETLSIIAYNPKITRAEIEAIRGVNSDGTIYKLLDYNLIEDSGKLDAPGRPTTYSTTKEFLRMFGLESLDALPELPRYKLDENQQIVTKRRKRTKWEWRKSGCGSGRKVWSGIINLKEHKNEIKWKFFLYIKRRC